MTQTAVATKQADIRYRVELKNKPHIVVYLVRSSDDIQDYQVTLCRGKVNNCTCPARKPCYHMRDVQAHEDARKARLVAEQEAAMTVLSREAYVEEFSPNYIPGMY